MYFIAELSKPHIIPAHQLRYSTEYMPEKVLQEYTEQKLYQVAFNGIKQLKEFIKKNKYEDRITKTYKKDIEGKKTEISI